MYVGDDASSFGFEDFNVKGVSNFSLSYTSTQVNPFSSDPNSDLDLPEDIEFDSATSKFTVRPQKKQSIEVRVKGCLFFYGSCIATQYTTFKITILNRNLPKRTECDPLSVNDLTVDPDKPTFELPDLTDPETGLSLDYKVTFDSALSSIMSYKKATRKITTDTSTVDSGKKPGLYTIDVETTCNG